MKNVTISLSEDLVHILDSICKDCNVSRYAFAKEALLEKIEKHTKKWELRGIARRKFGNRYHFNVIPCACASGWFSVFGERR